MKTRKARRCTALLSLALILCLLLILLYLMM